MDTATSLAQAFTKMNEFRPGLLVGDVALPGPADGLTLLAQIRRDRATTGLPVIVLAKRAVGTTN